jgi:hypothetical protein
MKDYVLNKIPEPASNDMVWAFDLGKGSIGEAVRRGNEFLHKASLLIPAEFAETKTAAGRRRMWRTRQALKAWLFHPSFFLACQPDCVSASIESLLKMPESVSMSAFEKNHVNQHNNKKELYGIQRRN